MKKLIVRMLAVSSILAFAATVAAAEAPRAESSKDEGTPTLSCTKSGMTCGSSGQCCSKSCSKPSGRVVGRCD